MCVLLLYYAKEVVLVRLWPCQQCDHPALVRPAPGLLTVSGQPSHAGIALVTNGVPFPCSWQCVQLWRCVCRVVSGPRMSRCRLGRPLPALCSCPTAWSCLWLEQDVVCDVPCGAQWSGPWPLLI